MKYCHFQLITLIDPKGLFVLLEDFLTEQFEYTHEDKNLLVQFLNTPLNPFADKMFMSGEIENVVNFAQKMLDTSVFTTDAENESKRQRREPLF